MPLPPYIHAPLGDPSRYQTVFAGDPRQCRRADGRPPPHRRTCSVASPPPVSAWRRSSSSSGSTRSSRSAPPTRSRPSDAHRALPRPRVDRGRRARRPRRGGRRRHHGGAGTRVGRRTGRAGGSHRPLHPSRLRLAGRRRADDQLPPAPLVAAGDDRRVRRDRWRRLYDEALAGDYRFLSFGDAMLLDRTSRR